MVERFHRQLKAGLRAADNPSWQETLPLVLLGIRSTVKADFPHTPADLVYGGKLRLPGEFVAPNARTPPVNYDSYASRLASYMRTIRPPQPREQVRSVYVPPDLLTCTHVWVRVDGTRSTLDPHYQGPFEVLTRRPKAFVLKRNGKRDTVSIDRLKVAFLEGVPSAPVHAPFVPDPSPIPVPVQPTPAVNRRGREIRIPSRFVDAENLPGLTMDDAYYPIAVLLEELRNDDVQLRLNSIRQLKTIALTLGPEKTRSQLIPFITETISDDDDVMYVLAEQLESLVPYVGGPEYAHSILPPLETLATVEEVTVRDAAVESIRKIAALLTPDAVDQYLLPLVDRLVTGEWFTGRSSSCALLSVIYPRVNSKARMVLLQAIKNLTVDESPLVRRALAGRLGEIALAMCSENLPTANNPVSTVNPLTTTPTTMTTSSTSSSVENTTSTSITTNTPTPPTPTANINTTTPNDGSSGDVDNTEDKPVSPSASSEDNPPIDTNNISHLADSASHSGDLPPPPAVKTTNGDDSGATVAASEFTVDPLDPVVEQENVKKVICPMFYKLTKDEQESVRSMTIESIVGMFRMREPVMNVIRRFVHDKSWRVRCMLAEKMVDLFLVIDEDQPNTTPDTAIKLDFVQVFTSLMNDGQPEVVAVIVTKIKPLIRCVLNLPPIDPNGPVTSPSASPDGSAPNLTTDSNDVVTSSKMTQESWMLLAPPTILASALPPPVGETEKQPPSVQKVQIDSDASVAASETLTNEQYGMIQTVIFAAKELEDFSYTYVRCMAVNALLSIIPFFKPKQATILLLPVLLTYLDDFSPEVRFNLISNLDLINTIECRDRSVTESLLPSVFQLADDPRWRVRLVLIELMPILAGQMSVKVFDEEMTGICLSWLKDEVCAIREAAVENLLRLGLKFGQDWIVEAVIPKMIAMSTHTNYLYRMICLHSIIRLSELVDSTVCEESLLPTTLSMHFDKVANVRFKVAQALSRLGKNLSSSKSLLNGEVASCLRKLVTDPDRDVRFYAVEAMDTLHLPITDTNTTDPSPIVQSKADIPMLETDLELNDEVVPMHTLETTTDLEPTDSAIMATAVDEDVVAIEMME